MTDSHPADLFEFLERIERRPALYTHDLSLDYLEALIDGYDYALHVHKITEVGSAFNFRFRDYVRAKLGGADRPWSEQLNSNFLEQRRRVQTLLRTAP
jgi:hypothetical protein